MLPAGAIRGGRSESPAHFLAPLDPQTFAATTTTTTPPPPPPPSAPARGAPQALLTADERDEIAGMATADDGLFASVEAQLSGLGAAPDA